MTNGFWISTLLVLAAGISGCREDNARLTDKAASSNRGGSAMVVSPAMTASDDGTGTRTLGPAGRRVQVPSVPGAPTSLSVRGKAAFRLIYQSTMFAPGLVGDSASIPPEIPAFQTLLREPQADAAFKLLYRKGRPETRVWALCGIYYTDYRCFQAEANRLKGSNTPVSAMRGCVLSSVPMSELIVSTDTGAVRLANNKETLEEWRARNPRKASRPLSCDILGGAYPEVLRTLRNQ